MKKNSIPFICLLFTVSLCTQSNGDMVTTQTLVRSSRTGDAMVSVRNTFVKDRTKTYSSARTTNNCVLSCSNYITYISIGKPYECC